MKQETIQADQEIIHLLHEWNDTTTDFPADRCLHHLFEDQVARSPQRCALLFEDSSYSYLQLNQRANQLAHHLQQQGVGPDVLVGVCMQRSLELVVALLAILKAGGAYVPLEPSYPPERLSFMLQDADLSLVLTQQRFRHLLPSDVSCLCLDPDWHLHLPEHPTNVSSPVTPEHLAYLIYTSGSTGRPKGVMNEHRGVVNRLCWMLPRYPLTPDDSVLQKTPFSFDVSVWEFFWPLLAGARLVLARPGGHQNPSYLLDLIRIQHISATHFVPSMLQAFLHEPDLLTACQSLKWVICSGEALPRELQDRFFHLMPQGVSLHNLYGPTEAAIEVSAWVCDPDDDASSVPIGRPIANTRLSIVNEQLQPVPVGVAGELLIGGVGVARGYWRRPELTAEKFVPDPFSTTAGARVFRTGDLARYRPDGVIEFLGRLDQQIKIRGFRVELGEIEAVLHEHPAVSQCVVLPRTDRGTQHTNLVAYIVSTLAQGQLVTILRTYLQERLPEYMLPDAFVGMTQFPLSSNGKTDRAALPRPLPEHFSSTAYVAPRDVLEEVIEMLWVELLGLSRIGVHTSFFQLGGNSLLAVQLMAHIQHLFEQKIALTTFFTSPTIAELAHTLATEPGQHQQTFTRARIFKYVHTLSPFDKSALYQEKRPRLHSYQQDSNNDESFPHGELNSTQENELLHYLLAEQGIHTSSALTIPRYNQHQHIPLSSEQERLWHFEQLHGSNATYNIAYCFTLQGHLDPEALLQSLHAIAQRHEILRTTLHEEEGAVFQFIHTEVTLSLPCHDLRPLTAAARAEQLALIGQQEARQPFVLCKHLPMRTQLLHCEEQAWVLLLTFHHSAFDGWSESIFLQELQQYYQGFLAQREAALAPLPIQYTDFALWQREVARQEQLQEQRHYWAEQLRDAPQCIALPIDKPLPGERAYLGATLPVTFDLATTKRLHALAEREQSTLFMLMLSLWGSLLSRYSGQDDILIATPSANRVVRETEPLIGFFANTLPLRVRVHGSPGFSEVIRRVRAVTWQAYEQQDLPFEQILQCARSTSASSQVPQVQTLLVLQNVPQWPLRLPDLTVTIQQPSTGTAKFDLTLDLTENENGLTGFLEYSTELFTEDHMLQVRGHLQVLLHAVLDEPEKPITQLPLLTEQELVRQLETWNDTQTDFPADRCLHHLFEDQVARSPQRCALLFEDSSYSYLQLNQRANQLAHHLQQQGVGPDVLVGVCMQRSLELVVALLAILKAGGAYVPLEPSYPPERLSFMLQDADLSLVLTQQRFRHLLPSDVSCLCLDPDWHLHLPEHPTNVSSPVTPEHLAYLIYTSGSTGRPKGVMNEHRGVVNRLCWMLPRYPLTPDDSVLQKTPFSFDVSVWEFFWPLLAGARLVLARPGGHQNPSYLLDLIRIQHISATHFVPSMLQAFLHEPDLLTACQSLKWVICSGEALPRELQDRFFHLMPQGVSLHNLYGPTEAAIEVSAWVCDPDDDASSVPIGRPIANTRLSIVNEQLQPVPVGVAGELLIGGVGVARGYWRRPELTAEKFVPDPFSTTAGARVFRTGDLARYRPDGVIEFLGRLDQQIKIRGFRVELGEIEAVLHEHPAVSQCVVTDYQLKSAQVGLVAYLTGSCTRQPTLVEPIRQHLSRYLPAYMVPTRFVLLDKMPLTASGKIDRKALPDPYSSQHGTEGPDWRTTLSSTYLAPRTEVETLLKEIWEEYLAITPIGVQDRFEELGGDSLLLLQIISRLYETFQVRIPIRDFLSHPTIEAIAQSIDAGLTHLFDPEMERLLQELELQPD